MRTKRSIITQTQDQCKNSRGHGFFGPPPDYPAENIVRFRTGFLAGLLAGCFVTATAIGFAAVAAGLFH